MYTFSGYRGNKIQILKQHITHVCLLVFKRNDQYILYFKMLQLNEINEIFLDPKDIFFKFSQSEITTLQLTIISYS